MANLIGKVTARFDDPSLEDALSDILLQESRKRKDRMRQSIKRRVRTLLKNHIKKHPVLSSIRGVGQENSLAAEFGLTSEIAYSAVRLLTDKVSQAPRAKIIESRTGRRSKIEISVVGLESFDLREQIDTDDEPFSYLSQPTSPNSHPRLIRWMDLVLNPRDRLIDSFIPDVNKQTEDGRVYSIVRGNFSEQFSRSGLAVMRLSTNRNNFPYTIPKILIPTGRSSNNFLDDIVASRSFTSGVREIIADVVNREMGS